MCARPKSVIQSLPRTSKKDARLESRWTMPQECAYSSASAASATSAAIYENASVVTCAAKKPRRTSVAASGRHATLSFESARSVAADSDSSKEFGGNRFTVNQLHCVVMRSRSQPTAYNGYDVLMMELRCGLSFQAGNACDVVVQVQQRKGAPSIAIACQVKICVAS